MNGPSRINTPKRSAAAFVVGVMLLGVSIIGALGSFQGTPVAPDPDARWRVDLNQADQSELMLLPRIGDALSRRIIEDRAENGLYTAAKELDRVHGIGPRTIESVTPFVRDIERP